MADNIPAQPNNGSPNFGSGLYPMPMPATSSEADGTVKVSWPTGAQGGMSAPATGGNDGDVDDSALER